MLGIKTTSFRELWFVFLGTINEINLMLYGILLQVRRNGRASVCL